MGLLVGEEQSPCYVTDQPNPATKTNTLPLPKSITVLVGTLSFPNLYHFIHIKYPSSVQWLSIRKVFKSLQVTEVLKNINNSFTW